MWEDVLQEQERREANSLRPKLLPLNGLTEHQ